MEQKTKIKQGAAMSRRGSYPAAAAAAEYSRKRILLPQRKPTE
jgi:hypothetical protein